ncbi:MAG: hypothetical protein L0312_23030 [Acidobacteria bacterium]|nr:hypothetical protein [Acidobacteriota bacterium]
MSPSLSASADFCAAASGVRNHCGPRGWNSQADSIHSRIEARLRVEPAPEVDFDVVLELTTDRYTVKPREAP